MTKDYHIIKPNTITDKFKDIGESQLSRKKFIGGIIMGGILANIPFTSTIARSVGTINILLQNQLSIIESVQKILYPSYGNGPGARDVMADKYLLWVLSDKRMDPEEKDYIISGIAWVDETAEENYSRNYNHLTQNEKELLIADISKESWGSSWLGVILNFIFEALLSDPQYGGNSDKIGWDWVHHHLGYPRPTKPLLYPEIFKTVSKHT